MLYYIHQTPLFSWRVEGGSGFETRLCVAQCIISVFQYPFLLSPQRHSDVNSSSHSETQQHNDLTLEL